MKKVIALALSLALGFGCMGSVFATDPKNGGTGTTTVYDSYVVQYHSNDSAATSVVDSNSGQYYDSKSETKVTTHEAFKREGYTFKGWGTKAENPSATFPASTEKSIADLINKTDNNVEEYNKTATAGGETANAKIGAINLYAIWTEVVKTVAITFDYNYPTFTPDVTEPSPTVAPSATAGQPYPFPTPTPSLAGYAFKGWFAAETGGNPIETNATVPASPTATTLYAQWEANEYTVTFNANGGTWPSATPTAQVTYGGTYATAIPSATPAPSDGQAFAGWYTAATNGNKVEAATQVTATADHTLYAHYTPAGGTPTPAPITIDTTYKVTATYNGQPHAYEVRVTSPSPAPTDFAISYTRTKDGKGDAVTGASATTTAPTDAGTYSVTVTRVADTNYTAVSVTIADGVVINRATPSLNVNDYPTASAVVKGEALSTSTLTSSASSGSFAWKDGATVVDATGSFTVVYTPNDANNYKTLEINVQVVAEEKPVIESVTVNGPDYVVKDSGAVTYTATVNGTGTVPQDVEWTVEGGNSSTTMSANGALTVASGETAASLTVKATAKGTQISGTMTVAVQNPGFDGAKAPTITTEPVDVPDAKVGMEVTLKVAATGSANAALTYQWYNGDGTAITGETGPEYKFTPATAGVYNYYVVVTETKNGTTATTASNNVKVTVKNVIVPVQSVVMSKTDLSLQVGDTDTLRVTITPENATNKTVVWTAEPQGIVSVDENGNVKALAKGTAIITATVDGKTATCTVTVTKKTGTDVAVTGVSVDPASKTLNIGETQPLTATVSPPNADNKTVTWESDNEAVATVSASGVVTAVKEGKAVITVTTQDGGFTAKATITVNPAAPVEVTGVAVSPSSAALDIGATQQLIATVSPSNAANKTVTWKSDNEAVATVSASGLVTAVKEGEAVITVTTNDGGFTAKATITVNAKDEPGVVRVTGVSLDTESVTLKAGSYRALTATVIPANATNRDVVWASSNEDVATVSQNGQVAAKAAGKAEISVTTVDGSKRAVCVVTVTGTNDNSSGGSSGGGGGSGSGASYADKVSGNTTNTTGTTGGATAPVKTVTPKQAEQTATTALNTAIAKATQSKSDTATAAVTFKNVQMLTPDVFKTILTVADNAENKSGISIKPMIQADTLSKDGKVEARMYIDPEQAAKIGKNINTAVTIGNKSVENVINKYFKNKEVQVMNFAHKGEFGMKVQVAVKVDVKNFNLKNAKFYSIDPATNKIVTISNANAYLDKNGYLHFETSVGNNVFMTDGPLVRK